MKALDVARLDFEMAANILERALGRGGAPQDLDRARVTLPIVLEKLQHVAAAMDEAQTRS